MPLDIEKKRARQRTYYQRNKDRILAKAKERRKQDRVETLSREKAYREKNRQAICENQKQFKKRNPEKGKAYSKKYRKSHPERSKIQSHESYIRHKESKQEYQRRYRAKNRDVLLEKRREHYKANREAIVAQKTAYREANRERLREQNRIQKQKTKGQEGLHQKIRSRLSRRIYRAVKLQASEKAMMTARLVGCSMQQLIEHLENKFEEGMCWENYGRYGWHIDHIIPCALFDLTDPEEQKRCFHYSNLQPLWAKDNLSKGKKLYSSSEAPVDSEPSTQGGEDAS